LEKRAIFRVSSPDSFTFRVLDEHGLVDLWHATSEQGGRPGQSTFGVRNHGWHRESELSFAMSNADHSFMVATGWACLEIVAGLPPSVEFVRSVEAISMEGPKRLN
jgi:hypothetical protein